MHTHRHASSSTLTFSKSLTTLETKNTGAHVIISKHFVSARPIIGAKLNEVHAGIGKVESFGGVVDGQGVGPEQVLGHQGNATAAVQARALDARVLTPVGPEQIASPEINGQVKSYSTGKGYSLSKISISYNHFKVLHSSCGMFNRLPRWPSEKPQVPAEE